MDDVDLEAQPDGDAGDDEPMVWEWRPSGESCARCEAMAGLYEDEPPAPPHSNCDCEVILVGSRGDGDGARAAECRRELSYEFLTYEGLDADDRTATLAVDFMVHCPDGSDVPVSVEVEMDLAPFEGVEPTDEQYALWVDLIIAAALEKVEEVAGRDCLPCEPRLVG